MNKCDTCFLHKEDEDCEMMKDTKSWNPLLDEEYEVTQCTDYIKKEN